MLLQNLKVRIKDSTDDMVIMATELDQHISIPKVLLPEVQRGAELFLAIDTMPLVSAEKNAKDILNEMIGK